MNDFFQELITESSTLSLLEILAVSAALIYVYLAAKANALCFLFGFISSCIYTYICFKYKLYFDTIINLYYMGMSVVGWYFWKRPQKNQLLKISHLQKPLLLKYLIFGLLISILLGFLANENTDASIPYLDAFTTVFAILATWMVVKKQIENWLIWIVVDGLSIGMYFYKGLYFTSFLFLLYTLIAMQGYFSWRKKMLSDANI